MPHETIKELHSRSLLDMLKISSEDSALKTLA